MRFELLRKFESGNLFLVRDGRAMLRSQNRMRPALNMTSLIERIVVKSIVVGLCLLATAATPAFSQEDQASVTVEESNVTVEEARYEDRPIFRITTPSAQYYFDRAGGGLSRMIDIESRDWISFSKDPLKTFPDSAAAGYRGIPNLVFGQGNPDAGVGHPGFDKCESEFIPPNMIRTTSKSGKWQWAWTFDDFGARFKMEKADAEFPWWFLYEGPIAGSFAPKMKFWGSDVETATPRSPDSKEKVFQNWQWVYLGDRRVRRVLFIHQAVPDRLQDTLWFLGSSDGGSIDSNDGMVVFGFGRGPGTKPLFRGAGQEFTIGFIELDDDSYVGTKKGHAYLREIIESRSGRN